MTIETDAGEWFQAGTTEERLDDIQQSLGVIAILLARLVAKGTGKSDVDIMEEVLASLLEGRG